MELLNEKEGENDKHKGLQVIRRSMEQVIILLSKFFELYLICHDIQIVRNGANLPSTDLFASIPSLPPIHWVSLGGILWYKP